MVSYCSCFISVLENLLLKNVIPKDESNDIMQVDQAIFLLIFASLTSLWYERISNDTKLFLNNTRNESEG